MKNEIDVFQRLYDENYQRMRRFLGRLVGPQEADDLAQVVFAKAARGLPNFHGHAQASTWLYRIAANVASDWLRSRTARDAKSTVQVPNALDHTAYGLSANSASHQSQKSPEQELFLKEMQICIRRVIGQLPDKHRTVLMLAEIGGFTDNEVAETLGISRGNAKVRLHRARAQLKNELETHCDFSHNENNEFVCEPKAAACNASSDCAGRSRTIGSEARPGNEIL